MEYFYNTGLEKYWKGYKNEILFSACMLRRVKRSMHYAKHTWISQNTARCTG